MVKYVGLKKNKVQGSIKKVLTYNIEYNLILTWQMMKKVKIIAFTKVYLEKGIKPYI